MTYATSAKAFLCERKLNGSLVLKMTATELQALNRDFILWRRSRELANLSVDASPMERKP